MSRLDEVGAADGWRCWICDAPVDPDMSVNDPRGPSIDNLTAKSKSKGNPNTFDARGERLAHRACNTRKGAVAAVVPWPDALAIVDAAPIVTSVERFARKGGKEVMARCPTHDDAAVAADWLAGRLSRLAPDLALHIDVEPGGGQFLVVLRT